MINLMRRGTATDDAGITWEFHGDDGVSMEKVFYITPQPEWIIENEVPKIQIVEYQTSDELNGSGYCLLEVQLGVPDIAKQAVTKEINLLYGVADPIFQTLPVQSGTIANITYPDGQGGTEELQVSCTDFASNLAIFQIPMDADQLKTIKATMEKQGTSPFTIEYVLKVNARMPAVDAAINFDSEVAYNYQVTAHPHTKWAQSTTYTYDINQLLTESNAAKITVNKSDPNLPESIVDSVRGWAQNIVQDRVADEVKKALDMQQSGQGTQSFEIKDVSSFSETYSESEVVVWRLNPQATLKSFSELGMNIYQIEALEPIIDKRQFVFTLTPQVSFKTDSNISINKSDTDPLSNIKKLTSLEVTLIYPTLETNDKTYRFTKTEIHSWKANWDTTSKGNCSLTYTATYEDGQQLTNTIENLDVTDYTLTLMDIGLLNVTFNATRFFSKEAAIIKDITVEMVYDVPEQKPFLQSFVLDSNEPTYIIQSQFSTPITTNYLYTLTYDFNPDVKANPYTSDVKSQNGLIVRVDDPDFTKFVSINAFTGTQEKPLFIEGTVSIYYNTEPYFPNIPASSALPKPTASSPIQFDFEPGDKAVQLSKFNIFANSIAATLSLDASLIDNDGNTYTYGPVEFDPTVDSILFKIDKEFTFLKIDPIIVDWSTNKLRIINVSITKVSYNKADGTAGSISLPGTTRSINYDPQRNKAFPVHYQVTGLPANYSDISFAWEATYVYEKGSKTIGGTQKGTILELPVEIDSDTPVNPGN